MTVLICIICNTSSEAAAGYPLHFFLVPQLCNQSCNDSSLMLCTGRLVVHELFLSCVNGCIIVFAYGPSVKSHASRLVASSIFL
jgi:hypothetical protein